MSKTCFALAVIHIARGKDKCNAISFCCGPSGLSHASKSASSDLTKCCLIVFELTQTFPLLLATCDPSTPRSGWSASSLT